MLLFFFLLYFLRNESKRPNYWLALVNLILQITPPSDGILNVTNSDSTIRSLSR